MAKLDIDSGWETMDKECVNNKDLLRCRRVVLHQCVNTDIFSYPWGNKHDSQLRGVELLCAAMVIECRDGEGEHQGCEGDVDESGD